jgi:hypothetical protein
MHSLHIHTDTAEAVDETVTVVVRDARPGAQLSRDGTNPVLGVVRSATPVSVGDEVNLDDGTCANVVRVSFDYRLVGARGPDRIQMAHVA